MHNLFSLNANRALILQFTKSKAWGWKRSKKRTKRSKKRLFQQHLRRSKYKSRLSLKFQKVNLRSIATSILRPDSKSTKSWERIPKKKSLLQSKLNRKRKNQALISILKMMTKRSRSNLRSQKMKNVMIKYLFNDMNVKNFLLKDQWWSIYFPFLILSFNLIWILFLNLIYIKIDYNTKQKNQLSLKEGYFYAYNKKILLLWFYHLNSCRWKSNKPITKSPNKYSRRISHVSSKTDANSSF